jgi:15-cis-phytoene synthase
MNPVDVQACKALMRDGSKSFYLSSLALPQRVRLPATALYAFCRVADDAIDNSAEPGRALADLQARLDAVYAGTPRARSAR